MIRPRSSKREKKGRNEIKLHSFCRKPMGTSITYVLFFLLLSEAESKRTEISRKWEMVAVRGISLGHVASKGFYSDLATGGNITKSFWFLVLRKYQFLIIIWFLVFKKFSCFCTFIYKKCNTYPSVFVFAIEHIPTSKKDM